MINFYRPLKIGIKMLKKNNWLSILRYCDIEDLYNCRKVNKLLCKLCDDPEFGSKLRCGLKNEYKLNYIQIRELSGLINKNNRINIICGKYGTSKSIISICFSIYMCKHENKIILIVSPQLISVYSNILTKYFDINPKIFHNINPDYNSKIDYINHHKEKVYIISSNLYKIHKESILFNNNNDIYIHDKLNFNKLEYSKRKDGSLNVYIYDQNDIYIPNTENISIIKLNQYNYNYNYNTIIYELPITKSAFKVIKYRSNSKIFNHSKLNCIPEFVSYPFTDYNYILNDIKIENKIIKSPSRDGTQSLVSLFKDTDNKNFLLCLENNNKFQKVLNIISDVFTRNEKIVLYDFSDKYLPWMYFLFNKYNIKSYLYTSYQNTSSRQKNIDLFKSNTDSCILVTSYNLLSDNYILYNIKNIIFYSTTLNKSNYSQTLERCIGNKLSNINIYHIHLGKIDRLIYNYAYGKKSKYLFENNNDIYLNYNKIYNKLINK